MIDISFQPFIGFSSPKMGEFRRHQVGEIFLYVLSDIHSNHLKKFFRLLLDVLENVHVTPAHYSPEMGGFRSVEEPVDPMEA